MTWLIALAIKPLVMLLLLIPGAFAVYYLRRMPECKLKRVLLFSWRV